MRGRFQSEAGGSGRWGRVWCQAAALAIREHLNLGFKSGEQAGASDLPDGTEHNGRKRVPGDAGCKVGVFTRGTCTAGQSPLTCAVEV